MGLQTFMNYWLQMLIGLQVLQLMAENINGSATFMNYGLKILMGPQTVTIYGCKYN